MSVGRFLQQAAAGNAGVGATYVDDVFSTYLYDGNATARNIVNDIDLSGKGGLVWTKERSDSANHYLYDTERGALNRLFSNITNSASDIANSLTAFNNDGFSLGTGGSSNANGEEYVSWTFRKQPGFFDVVTYTGNATAGTEIAHNLGSAPGMIIVKRTNSTSNWAVYHRSSNYLVLNSTAAAYSTAITAARFGDGTNVIAPTESVFTIGGDADTNQSGSTYVAYLFAHDAQDFGTDSDESIIKCGSYTGTGSAQDIDLGFEPQWILIKRTNTSDAWILLDSMRGISANSNDPDLHPNDSNYESQQGAVNFAELNSDGIKIDPGNNGYGGVNSNGSTYIYVAIRRPHKPAEEFAATDLFHVETMVNSSSGEDRTVDTGFNVDSLLFKTYDTSSQWFWADRLRGTGNLLIPDSTAAEDKNTNNWIKWDTSEAISEDLISWNNDRVYYAFRRAPGFFDVVTYTGSSSAQEIPHNLGVTPELIIQKCRTQGYPWNSWYTGLTNSQYINFNDSPGVQTSSNLWGTNATVATDSVFRTGGGNTGVDGSTSDTHIAFLFASVAGISKVGTFNRPSQVAQDIDCGFENGARFVLIKRTNTTGNWVLWDSVRGIVAGNEPYLLTNTAAAQVTNQDYIDPLSSGFTLTSGIATGDWVFLAIA